jgi:hypothetical protein
LMDMLEDLDKPWRIRIKQATIDTSSSVDAQDAAITYDDWQSPTIRWLSDPQIFSPSSCPKMKVGKAGVYDSAEEYMDVVHRLWVAMTFFDGHAAIAPHCRSRGNNGACGNALWPVADSQSQHTATLKCRSKGCSRQVEFCCRIRSHDALCDACASRCITNHLGGPTPNASTHVYDARVKHVNPDGIVYLTHFKSRNPPPNAIHWRTTRRLASPNLVGVVRLNSQGSALAASDQIKWAEVVCHDNPRDEDRKREAGQLAVSISSIVQCDPDYFEAGLSVAVIDCMTFVPEWIPVLRALDSQRFAKLPFESGRHLNLLMDRPIPRCEISWGELLPADASTYNHDALIKRMIDTSGLEPVREIRRDESLRNQLCLKLVQLVKTTTLDRMQLISFIESLGSPVHLTQGPPGE